MNRDITLKASLMLRLHSQRLGQEILLSRLPCERANNRAFIFNGLNHKICKIGHIADVKKKKKKNAHLLLRRLSFTIVFRTAREPHSIHACDAIHD